MVRIMLCAGSSMLSRVWRCITDNGLQGWQLDLLRCYATVPKRLAALQHLPQESAWRQAVVRYDRRLWEHLPDEASAWQDDDSVADESKEAPDDAPRQCDADLQSLSASVAVQVACYVSVSTATGDAPAHDVTAAQDVLVAIAKLTEELQLLTSVALQHREKAEARLALARQQQHAMQALDRAVRQAQTDVEVAVARVHAAATGTERSVVDDAVHRRRTAVEAATTAVQRAVDECTRSGMTEADVSNCAPGAAAQTLLVQLRRDADTGDLVQELADVRCCQVGGSWGVERQRFTPHVRRVWRLVRCDMLQRLYKELTALFEVEDAESDAKIAFERLNKKKLRRTAHVTDSDVRAGQEAIARAHANVLKCKSRVDDVVEMLSAFQAAAFPEVAFHMFVWGTGWCLPQLVTIVACLCGQCWCDDASRCRHQSLRPGPSPHVRVVGSPH